MEHPEAPPGPLAVLVGRMKEVRQLRGLTAQQLAVAMTAEGVKWDRSAVTKLENGHRQTISVVEWLTLAYVLNAAPLSLLFPLDDANYQVTPNSVAPPEEVWRWAAGQGPLRRSADGAPVDFDGLLDYFRALPRWKQTEERHLLAKLAEPDADEIVLDDDNESSPR